MAPRGARGLLLATVAVVLVPRPVHDTIPAPPRVRAEAVVVPAPPATVVPANPIPRRPRTSRSRPLPHVAPGATGAVQAALSRLGTPYRWGGTGPGSYDCSGLSQWAWRQAGVSLPRTSYEQWRQLPHIPLSQLQPGDLVFFRGGGHVGIYVGNGVMVHAPHRGDRVRYASIRGAIGAARP